MAEHEEPPHCDCCQATGVPLVETEHMNARYRGDHPGEKFYICDLCYSTFIFNAMCYNYDNAPLYQSLAYIGNEILKAVRGVQPVNFITEAEEEAHHTPDQAS